MTTAIPDFISGGYPNPLDNFRSYSYHFIITAASSSEAIRSLLGKDSSGLSPVLSKVADIGLGEAIDTGNSTAYLVLDTRRFSQYSITELNTSHIVGSGDPINPQMTLTSGHFKLQDTTGITFYNFLMELFADKLKSSMASTVFLMTVMFSGHHYDGTVEHVVKCHLPFTMQNLSFEFTSAGTMFDIIMLMNDGFAAGQRTIPDEQKSNTGAIKSVATKGRDKTVGGLIDSLEAQLNDQSLNYFLKYNGVSSEQLANIKPGKLVQYMITIPPKWRAMLPNLATTSKNTEKRYPIRGAAKPVDKASADFEMTFAPTTTIDVVISKILEASTEFLNESSNAKRLSGQGVQYKINCVITSDDTTYTVHYDVYPHAMPQSKDIVASKLNYIEYDYIFTGKNSHIKDLRVMFDGTQAITTVDKKNSTGRNRFSVTATAGQKLSNINRDSMPPPAKPDATDIDRKTLLANDPIYMGVISKQQLDNNADHRDENITADESLDALTSKKEYQSVVAFLNYAGSLQLSMTIRGNPNLFQKFADVQTTGGLPPHTTVISSNDLSSLLHSVDVNNTSATATAIKNGVASAKQQYIDSFVTPQIDGLDQVMKPSYKGNSFDPLKNQAGVNVYGLYVKVNIKAPNVDYVGNYKDSANLFSDDFFYQGIYRIKTVDTNLSNGDFTQTLHMFPYVIA